MDKKILIIATIVAIVVVAVIILSFARSPVPEGCMESEQALKTEMIRIKVDIEMVGRGDTGTKIISDTLSNRLLSFKGIYLRQETDCASICPNHPNQCWTIVGETGCNPGNLLRECVNILGDMSIRDGPVMNWVEHDSVQIEKTGPTELTITPA